MPSDPQAMTPAALKVNKMMAGLACLMLLLLQVLQVDSRTMHRDKREVESPCSKLEFELKDPPGCRPCHLCSPNQTSRSFHPECQQKNPQHFSHHGGQVLWCDNPDQPLPDCPPLREDIILNKTDQCSQNGRKYAPGCQCTLSCGDEPSLVVRCGLNLTWEEEGWEHNARLETCQAALTSAGKDDVSSVNLLTTVVPVTVSVVLALAAVVGVVLACLYYKGRIHRKDSQGSASSSESSSENGSGVTTPLTAKKIEKDQKKKDNRTLLNRQGEGVDDLQEDTERAEREVSLPPPGDSSREEDKLLMRETAVAPESLSNGNNKKDAEVELTEIRLDLTSEPEKWSSCKALEALLKDRNKLSDFTKMFDQEYSYGTITWHDVAGRLLDWDRDDVNSSEYLKRPQHSECPGDGCMYMVMKEANQAGMGLVDLLNCLRGFQKFRNKTAETLLEKFWAEWKSKHIARSEGVCS